MPQQNHSFMSPLRYPGGKGQLANFMKLVIMQNGFSDGEYAEVYAGGAGVACSLLVEEFVSRIHINDYDKTIYAFWHSVLHETEALCRLINDTAVTMDQWTIQKSVHTKPNDHTLLELGFSTFFLNRTNRSGILKAGVIGGKNQSGEWKLDVRYQKADLILRIQRIARYAGRIEVHMLDAAEFIANVLPTLPARTFVYFDPPYYHKGKALYDSFYTHEHHVAIAHAITSNVQQPWIVSYDLTPEIEGMYSGCESKRYKVEYSAQNKYAGAEIMFHSDNLILPAGYDPCKVTRKDVGFYTPGQLRIAI